MKRITILFIAFLLANNLFAQISVSSSGKIGIGPSVSPGKIVHVKSPSIEMRLERTEYNYHNAVLFWPHTGTYSSTYPLWEAGTAAASPDFRIWRYYSGNTLIPFTIKTNGNVGIRKTSPAYALDVNGDIASYGVKITSDSRLKENMMPLNGSLSKLKQVNGISFDPVLRDAGASIIENSSDSIAAIEQGQGVLLSDSLLSTPLLTDGYPADSSANSSATTGGRDMHPGVSSPPKPLTKRYGVVAQEIKEIFPELVDQTEDGYYNVDYIGLIPVLIEALKEQQVMIDDMKEKIDILTEKAGEKTAAIEGVFETGGGTR